MAALVTDFEKTKGQWRKLCVHGKNPYSGMDCHGKGTAAGCRRTALWRGSKLLGP
jgi:hypothetical protein